MSKHKPPSTSPPTVAPTPSASAPRKPKSAASKPATTHAHHHQRPPPTNPKRTTLHPNPPRPRRGIPALPASISSTPTSSDTQQLTSTTSTPTTAAAARLQHLHATATLCHALHARNRNQHRAQLWFKHLGLLRRQLARLLALEVALFELRYGVVGAAEEVRRRFEREAEIQGQRERVERWLRECVVPTAWVGAGTVLGEGSFAGVGLVLMGVLADVRGLVGGPEQAEEGGGDGRAGAQSRQRRAHEGSDGTVGKRVGEDMGEVVQRRAALYQGSRSSPQIPAHREDLVQVDVPTGEASAHTQETKRASSPFAAFDDDDDALSVPAIDAAPVDQEAFHATTTTQPADVKEKKSKPRDKRKGNDEDRDKKARSKKKNKVTGNAIDDLFAGF